MRLKTIAALFLLAAGTAFAGDLAQRYELTLDRVLKGGPPFYTDDLVLADAIPVHERRFTNFSGDVSGRYIGALATAAQYSGRRFPSLDRVVTRLLTYQKSDGHFGDPMSTGAVVDNDMAILWGNGRLLIGLLEYYGLNKRADVLETARRIGDFLVKVGPVFNSEAVRGKYNGPKFAVGYICWTQNMEGLVALYRITGERKYLDLAKEMAARTNRHRSQHSHGFLSSVRGIVDLYRATGDRKYLEQAEAEWKGIFDSHNALIQGAVPEMFAPSIKRDEGCSEADWLRLHLDLWELTRKPEYLEQAELTLFNEFEFNQFHTGDFGHHGFTDTGISIMFARAWWCCTLHGLRAMPVVFRNVFHASGATLFYDLPVDGRGTLKGLAVRASSALERDGSIRLEVVKADASTRTLAIRQPAWASAVTVSLGGRKLPAQARNGYLEIKRAWKTGDVVRLAYGMRTRVVRKEGKTAKVAVFHGPWLLAVDEQGSPYYFDEPNKSNQALLPAEWEHAATPGMAKPFTVPVAHLKLKYLPGGYPMQPGAAVLRPIAEHTSGADINPLDFWLPLKGEAEKLDANYTGN